jgi:UDP-glucose 4-epimerase
MPLDYYDNNVNGTMTLLQALRHAGVRRMVFSSSATVYGGGAASPIREDAPRSGTNPYARCKIVVEDLLADLSDSEPGWRIASLRYFNPAGAHPSGLIGEAPLGVPNNLMPFLAQVAAGRRSALEIFGSDYPTPDGTGIRDYVHVMDVAEGHVAALRHLDAGTGALAVNLGTGQGTSVLQLIHAFERACGKPIPHRYSQRRAGDVAECWADTRLAKELLGWSASRTIADICADAWRWQEPQAT